MRDRSAPEARGSRQTGRLRLDGLIGLPLLLSLALAQTLFLPGHNTALATAGVQQHQLQAVLDNAKPNFSLSDLEGAQRELKQQAGRVVLVHFFATWCEPCREELSSLSRLHEQPRNEPLSVLAVNVAEAPVRVRRFLESAPVSFPVLLDADRAVTRAWGVSVLPTTFVLDRELVARLLVEGDLDWTRADVLAAIEQVGALKPK